MPAVLASVERDGALKLLEAVDKDLAELQALCAEYFRKQDARFQDEPKGEEQNAWRGVAELLLGVGQLADWPSPLDKVGQTTFAQH
jgi:hypothetical protein